jgi:SynChlorMet cassette protein ScmC
MEAPPEAIGASVAGPSHRRLLRNAMFSGSMATFHNHKTFVLKLDDRCAWNLSCTDGTETWLKHFASVMGLRRGQKRGLPQIRFIRGKPAGPAAINPPWRADVAELQSLPERGWVMDNVGLVRFWSSGEGSDLVCELLNSPARKMALLMMEQALQPLYLKALELEGVPLHGALVALNGQGVVIAGANDAGKTTCCSRLPPPWKVLGDDETLVIRRGEAGYFAHPLPTWSNHFQRRSGRSCDVGERVSLDAVFFLEQAPFMDIRPLGRGRAAGGINESARQAYFWRLQGLESRDRGTWSTMLFENACTIARTVPAYTLRLNLTDRFWERIERLLENLRTQRESVSRQDPEGAL